MIHEDHTTSGGHRVREQPFPDWVLTETLQVVAERLSMEDALAELPEGLRPS